MEARFPRAARRLLVASAALIAVFAISHPATATNAGYRTKNFTVAAPTPQLAKEIGAAAEQWRRELAHEWLGKELPPWSKPCPISAMVASNLGAGGATSFIFDNGEVFGWTMNIQGSRERVLDSVLPHEITHTIFATHFRQPLPRWADEGACTTVEHRSEVEKQERMLIDFLQAGPGRRGRGIPFDEMFHMTEYPQDVLPLYAQGHSLAKFLIDQRGKAAFMNFLADGMQDKDWPRAIKTHYQYEHLLTLQNSWMDWIRAGRPPIQPVGGVNLASAQTPAAVPASVDTRPVAAAKGQPTVTPRSVYGESASWAPARSSQPVASTAGYDPPASTAETLYDAARPAESAWR